VQSLALRTELLLAVEGVEGALALVPVPEVEWLAES